MKTLFLFLAILFAIPSVSLAFFDVSANHRFAGEIEFVKQQNIVSGYPSTSSGTVLFKPEATINRAEFTKIIISALYPKEVIYGCNTSKHSFSDVAKTDWFAPFVCVAKNNGIVHGYSDGTFKAGNTITLPEAMKIILEAYNVDLSDYETIESAYSEERHPIANGKWYGKYMHYFVQRMVYPDIDKFPKLQFTDAEIIHDSLEIDERALQYKISRGEMAYFIQKMLKQKEIFSDVNFQTISNINAGFSVQVPKRDDLGTITAVENWDAVNNEYTLSFKNSGYPTEVLLEFFSKKMTKDAVKEYFRPQLESLFPEDGIMMGMDHGQKLSDNNATEYAKRCLQNIQFSPLHKDDYSFFGKNSFYGDFSGVQKVFFPADSWCGIWHASFLYDTKNNRFIRIGFGHDAPFTLFGQGFFFLHFQIK